MRILPILQRLKDNVELLDGRVEQARSLTSLPDSEIKTGLPIAFVYSSSDSSEGQLSVGDLKQNLAVEFTVIMASRSIDADLDIEPMEDLRDQVKTALIGWRMAGAHSIVSFVSGSVMDSSSRTAWWTDTYSLKIII